jgi:hypothetical protein
MRIWLTGRRAVPPGTLALIQSYRVTESVGSVTQSQTLIEGVAAALKRLEEMEARSFTDLKRAQASGDSLLVKAAHQIWLRNSDSLRKYDLAIEQNRRDSGQLIPKDEILRLVYILKDAHYFALLGELEGACQSLVGLRDPLDAWSILNKLRGAVHASVIAWLRQDRKQPVPAWMVKAFTEGEFPCSSEKEEAYAPFCSALNNLMADVAATARAEVDKQK